jgi:hypothetical protein
VWLLNSGCRKGIDAHAADEVSTLAAVALPGERSVGLYTLLFGWLAPGLILTAIGVVKVRKYFRRGVRRLLLGSLVVALFASPTVIVGHGIAFFPAVVALVLPLDLEPVPFYWEPLWLGLVPMVATGIVAFAMGAVTAGIARLFRSRADTPDEGQKRLSAVQERRVLSAVAAVTCLLTLTGFAERWYLLEYLASYGPFVVDVQTDGQSLEDILVMIQPEGFHKHYSGHFQTRVERIARSGQHIEFPPNYLGPELTELTLTVIIQHPLLPWDFATHVTVPIRPHTRVILPTIHVPPWSDAELRAVHAGSRVPPILEQVTDPIVRVDGVMLNEFSNFSLRWAPSVCQHGDLEWVKRQYLPPLALAWTRVNFGDATAESAPGYLDNLAKDLDLACAASQHGTG